MEFGKAPSQLEKRICGLHEALQREYDSLRRIAIAVYDGDSDVLKTFLYSGADDNPLSSYEAKLASVPSLLEIARTGEPRVVGDLAVLAQSDSHHAKRIADSGLRSSYTLPIYDGNNLFGFLFYNSTEQDFFSAAVQLKLRLYSDLISLLVVAEVRPIKTLRAAVNTARGFARHRDNETGSHLERMARYARLIGKVMAPQYELTDNYVELLFQLSPLHDVGKIAVPDHILLKAGKLTTAEFETMKSHVSKGIEIVDMLMREFGLETLEYGQMLRNIVAGHHENVDGTGYPTGLRGDEIPLEARITRVADVFDALTSDRPYKRAWSNADAMKELRDHKGGMFDADCVDALASCIDATTDIQKQFEQDILG